MKKYTLTEIRALLERNTIEQPKAKYSNAIILRMLEHTRHDFTATVEPTRDLFPLNRGSLVECIIKSLLYGVADTFKTTQGRKDIDLREVDNRAFDIDPKAKGLEIKFATSFAYASASDPRTVWVLLVTPDGIFNVPSQGHKGRYSPKDEHSGRLNEVLNAFYGFEC